MPAGYTAVSATNLCDATGTTIANATISFKPVDNKGNSISFRAGGTSEGQASSQPVSTTVTNGAFTIQLADTTLTTPKNVGYTVTVIDNVTGDDLLDPDGYICVQPSGAEWSFDTYDPNYAAQITVQQGPQGLSAYEVYQSEGGTLDEADWLASLHGATGAPGLLSLEQIALTRTRLPQLRNLLDPSQYTANSAINSSGAIVPFAAEMVSNIFPVNSGGSMIANFNLTVDQYTSNIFLDASDAVVSFQSSNIAAGTPFQIPANAASMRVTLRNDSPPTNGSVYYIGNGTTLPASIPIFGASDSATVAYGLDSASAYANLQSNYANTLALAGRVLKGYNLFNSTAVIAGYYLPANFTPAPSPGNNVSDYIPLFPGQTMIANFDIATNGTFSVPTYDLNFNRVGQLPNTGLDSNGHGTIPAGTPFTVPAGMYWMRVTVQDVYLPSWMIMLGSSLPTNYLDYGEAPTLLASLPKPLQGVRVAIWGDSYSAYLEWQQTFLEASGANIVFQDVHSGRAYINIFENYLDDPYYSQVIGGDYTPIPAPAVYGDPVSGKNVKVYGQGTNGGTQGNTFTQDMVAANPQICVIFLGTNGASMTPVGTVNDAPGLDTLFATINRAIQVIQTALPSALIVLVTNLQPQDGAHTVALMQGMVQNLQAVGQANGLPVLDLLATSGFNQYNISTMFRSDNLHPSTAYGMPRIGSLIAGFLGSLAAIN